MDILQWGLTGEAAIGGVCPRVVMPSMSRLLSPVAAAVQGEGFEQIGQQLVRGLR
ncbi:hypothetical protein ACX80S_17240 [Arthrobacter sp. RHLT1-20]